jgi:osmoprotectant transport system ATP-binding protein
VDRAGAEQEPRVTTPVLELRGAVKRYGPGAGIGPVDLAVPPGRTLALIGPSGAGKSTILKLMLGLIRPDEGEVLLGGRQLDPGDDALRRRIGYVVQGGGLFPHLTAAGNASLVARHLGWDRGRVAARLEALAGLARLSPDVWDRFPSELSGGQSQRVSLVRALFLDPELLLLDEPLGALDPITRAELQEDLRAAFRAVRKTVVLVTHDLAEAEFFGDELALLREGRVAQLGSLEELVRAPAEPFVTRFVRAQRAIHLRPGDPA